jgi:hypothetical protein
MESSVQPQVVTSNQGIYNSGTRKKKMILILSGGIAAILVIVSLLVYLLLKGNSGSVSLKNTQPTPAVKQVIRDGQIIIADGAKLYQFNTNDMRKIELKIPELASASANMEPYMYTPTNLSFSEDGNYLFFTQNETFFIYDYQLKMAQSLPIFPNGLVYPAAVSPNNVIASVDTGTAPGLRGQTFIDFRVGKVLYKTTGLNVSWAPDSQHFALNTAGPEWSNLAVGPQPVNTSISLGTVGDKVTAKVIIPGTNSMSFSVIKWMDDNIILYQQEEFSKPIPSNVNNSQINDSAYQDEWMKIYEDPKTTYWTYDISTNQKREATGSADMQYDDEYPQDMSPTGKWKLITEGNQSPFGIYIQSTKNKPEKFRISSGDSAIWRPQ